MPTPRQIERRNRILSVSLNLFTEYGYQETTLDEVACRARVGKAVIYRYFGNKEALLLAVFDHVLSLLDSTLGLYPPDNASGPLVRRYQKAFAAYLKSIEQNKKLLDFVLRIIGSLPQSEWGTRTRQKIFDSIFATMLGRQAFLQKSIERQEMCKHDAGLAIYMVAGAVWGTIAKWHRDGCKPGLSKIAPEVVAFVMDGLKYRD